MVMSLATNKSTKQYSIVAGHQGPHKYVEKKVQREKSPKAHNGALGKKNPQPYYPHIQDPNEIRSQRGRKTALGMQI